MPSKRRRARGPMSAAGLISFYEEEFEGRVRLSPIAVLLLAIAVIVVVGLLHILF